MLRDGTCFGPRGGGTSTSGSFLKAPIVAYVRSPGLRDAHPGAGRTHKGHRMKTIKWYAFRATMFLGTVAAAVAVFDPNWSRRW